MKHSKEWHIERNEIPTVRDEKAGEEMLTVAFDLGLKTGEMPLAMVFQRCTGKPYIRKVLKNDEALELYKLLTE